jgi:outer membrane biosynthesis protein TonB
MQAIEVPSVITVDGIEHALEGFGKEIQHLVYVHTDWQNDLAKLRLEAAKTEAALRNLGDELSKMVQTALNPPAANDDSNTDTPAAPAAPVAPPPTPEPIPTPTPVVEPVVAPVPAVDPTPAPAPVVDTSQPVVEVPSVDVPATPAAQ